MCFVVNVTNCVCCHSALGDTEWAVLSYNIELMRLMRVAVTRRPASLSPKDWDIVLCRVVSMVQVGWSLCDTLL